MKNRTLFFQNDPMPASGFAVDTGGMQSASSFVEPADGVACPDSRSAFVDAANAYCNGSRIHFTLPERTSDEKHLPAMLRLWERAHRVPLVVTTDVVEPVPYPVGDFLALMHSKPDRLSNWLKFQFTPSITDEYFSRVSSDEPAAAVAQRATRLMKQADARTCIDQIQQMITDRQIQLVSKHGQFSAQSTYVKVGSYSQKTHYAVAYLLSCYLRGGRYGWQLRREGHRYRPLWLRSELLQSLPGLGTEAPAWHFPWGEVLAGAAEINKTWLDWNRMRPALQRIRKRTAKREFHDKMLWAMLNNKSTKDVDAFYHEILNILASVEIRPDLSPFLQQLLSRETVGGVLALAAAVVTWSKANDSEQKTRKISRRSLITLTATMASTGFVTIASVVSKAGPMQRIQGNFDYCGTPLRVPGIYQSFMSRATEEREAVLRHLIRKAPM